MAMIKCRECGHEISNMAEACPNCGAKTRFGEREKEKKAITTNMVVCIVLCAVGIILFFSGITTMMDDMSSYWGGYNYSLPWTGHELGVIVRIGLGLGWSVGGIIGIVKAGKSKI